MNNKCKFLIILSLIFMVATIQVQAGKYKGDVVKKSPKAAASCYPPSQSIELAFNNVRALLKTNGTMWFRERAEYEIPKGSGKTSLYSASLWVAGMSKSGQLYVAAMRFGQVGNDYYTGPLSMITAQTDQKICSEYDKFYRISRVEVQRHNTAHKEGDNTYVAPKSILDWPACGDKSAGQSAYLAPWMDVNGDGEYEPMRDGDYPYYDFNNELCPWTRINKERAKIPYWKEGPNGDLVPNDQTVPYQPLPMPAERIETMAKFKWDNGMIYADHVLKGDETIFWFLNDMGADHSESKGRPIGLEIRMQAFAFASNDELNKMTFYSYEIINRGATPIENCYFSQWCDPDLGFQDDDFVGCDVIRGLGYCYNGKEIDGTGQLWAYGANPPAVGLDFFQGPYIDADGADNPKFEREKANITGDPDQQEYCRKFVHHIFDYWKNGAPALLSEVHPTQTLVVENQENHTFDTVPIRWNNQFAINGVNFGDGIVDNERFGMRAFTYHNNENGPGGDPRLAIEYYRFLQGMWGDGQPFTYGGSGRVSPGTTGVINCKFIFPEGTDYCNWGTNGVSPGSEYFGGGRAGTWSEVSEGNSPKDRRFMQSAGPFTLKRGACNYVTVGVPWARANQGGTKASIALLMVADDKCQALFENCFKMLDGPDAPNLTIREYDQKLVLLLSNPPYSNNAREEYAEEDPKIPEKLPWDNTIKLTSDQRTYYFEGYQIFQVAGPYVSGNDLENTSLARLVCQYDIENYDEKGSPIGRLINWEFDESLQLSVPREKVNGSNAGINHSFEVTTDLFATGDRRLVNYKTYYFIAVAYAYNEWWHFSIDPADNVNNEGLQGQKDPYLRGRKTAEGGSVIPIQAIPHPATVHLSGTTLHATYGSIPPITRLDGQGNGGLVTDLTKETIKKIVEGGDHNDYRVRELHYEKNAGPLKIQVVDPLRLKPFDFTLSIMSPILDSHPILDSLGNVIEENVIIRNKTDVDDNCYWMLTIDNTVSDEELIAADLVNTDEKPIRTFISEAPIGRKCEQIIFPLGISITIQNIDFSTDDQAIKSFYKNKIYQKYKGDMYRIKTAFYQPQKIDMENEVVYENNGYQWITGLIDDDGNLPSNWIRAGKNQMGLWDNSNQKQIKGDFLRVRQEDFFFSSICLIPDGSQVSARSDRAFKDYSGKFGTICGGTWAPYVLTSPYHGGPQAKYTMPESPDPYDNSEGNNSKDSEYPLYNSTTSVNLSAKDGKGLHNYYKFEDLADIRNQPGYNQTMINLYSANVVITPDQNLWTRCIVLESCPDPSRSQGGALKNEPRHALSVGKDGKPDGSTDGFYEDGKYGMGWFPGYAVNIETGERLNMMFAENSDMTFWSFGDLINGNDMIFNPTSTYAIATRELEMFGRIFPAGYVFSKEMYDMAYQIPYPISETDIRLLGDIFEEGLGIYKIWGGMHYVYVCSSSGNTSPVYYLTNTDKSPYISTGLPNDFFPNARRNYNLFDSVFSIKSTYPVYESGSFGGYLDGSKKYPYYECGPYDKGEWLVQKFKKVLELPVDEEHIKERKLTKMQLFNNVMYTHIPMRPEDPELRKHWMSCDVTYKIRVTRPYMRYTSRWYESLEEREKDYPNDYPDNNGFPVYKFSTRELVPTYHDKRLYQSILDNINIVPNPYYAASLYETNNLQTMIKITNLPTDLINGAPITISIFTVNGTLVRTLTKGDSQTAYVNWDLKNHANIPVASGVYIIHVNCPGIGERILKFFCTMRQTDLN